MYVCEKLYNTQVHIFTVWWTVFKSGLHSLGTIDNPNSSESSAAVRAAYNQHHKPPIVLLSFVLRDFGQYWHLILQVKV